MNNNRFEETHNSIDNNSTQKQRYRLITGAFNDKVIADQIATEIKERYGLTVYVIPEQVKRSSSSLWMGYAELAFIIIRVTQQIRYYKNRQLISFILK